MTTWMGETLQLPLQAVRCTAARLLPDPRFPSFTGRESEHPWGESSPDDYRYGNQGYTDPREREREQHDMNKR